MVLSHGHDYLLPQDNVDEPPDVNDLAGLLADAMRPPLHGRIHRPTRLYLRARPEWAELLPHLKQIGVEVLSQDALLKWDQAFGDLQAQVEQAREGQTRGQAPGHSGEGTHRGKAMTRSRKAARTRTGEQVKGRLYTLEAFLFSGPVTEKFVRKNC